MEPSKEIPLEKRVENLEAISHIHEPKGPNTIDTNPEKADEKRKELEKIRLSAEDTQKAKKKGGIFGDPILEID